MRTISLVARLGSPPSQQPVGQARWVLRPRASLVPETGPRGVCVIAFALFEPSPAPSSGVEQKLGSSDKVPSRGSWAWIGEQNSPCGVSPPSRRSVGADRVLNCARLARRPPPYARFVFQHCVRGAASPSHDSAGAEHAAPAPVSGPPLSRFGAAHERSRVDPPRGRATRVSRAGSVAPRPGGRGRVGPRRRTLLK